MDQLRVAIQFLQKHGFWVGCGLITLLGLGAWYYAVSNIAEEAKTNTDKIKGANSKIAGVLKQKNHPNDASSKKMDDIVLSYAFNVKQGWDLVYAKQRDVLVWPDSFDAKFRRRVDALRPIESIPFPTPFDKEIPEDFRRQYRDWIRNELPKLAETVGAEWKVKSLFQTNEPEVGQFRTGEIPRTGGDGRNVVVDNSLVKWNPQNQQEIFETHFGFADKGDTPSTLRVLYAQESLWVLQSLAKTIAKVNAGAETRFEAAVREIDYVRVGQSAGGVVGKVQPVETLNPTAATGPSGYPGGIRGGVMPGAGPPPTEAGRAEGAAGAAVDPAAGRYVDASYQPLTDATRLRTSLTAPTQESDAVLAVAKRMPVRLRVRIDQHRVNRLLAECGNASLPFEIRQVRINRDSTATGSAAGGGGGYSSPPVNYGGENVGMNPAGGQAVDKADPNEITLELFGIVYLYNPANNVLLKLPENNGPPATAANVPSAPLTGVAGTR